MNIRLRELLQAVESWPDTDQAELVDYARVIEARRTGIYVLDDAERQAIEEGIDQANRGEFATDDEIAGLFRRFGV